MEQQGAAEVARLEALRRGPRGDGVFPALAEAHRRAGDPETALQVAREGLAERPALPAGRVALALALLDLGRVDEARHELAGVLAEVPDHARAAAALESQGPEEGSADEPLAEAELEAAFEQAEAEPDRMLDANHVAEATLRQVERGSPEGLDVTRRDSPFATETVASLLERQGQEERARAVREVASRRTAGAAQGVRREAIVSTLERWLANARRRMR